jgi:peptide/nickel transport system substrate-binding protein
MILTPLLLALAFIIACGGEAATSTPEVQGEAPTPTLFIEVVKQPSATPHTAGRAGDTPVPTPAGDTPVPTPAGDTPVPTPAGDTPVPTPTEAPPPAMMQVKTGGIIPMQMYAAPHSRPMPEVTSPGMMVLGPLYNQLVEYNPETANTDDIRCDLCTSWDVSEDGLTWVYELHPDAKWSDGTPVTAEDVIFTIDSIVDPDQFGDLWEGHKGRSRSGLFIPYHESSRAVDEHTVEVTLKYAAGSWHPALALETVKILPKHVVMQGKLQGYGDPDDLVTSGPFRHVAFTKDVSVEQTKNEDYFKEGRPYIDGIKHFIITDAGSAVAAYAAEQVLMPNSNADNMGSVETKQFLEDYGDRYNVFFVGPAGGDTVMMNTEKEPFDDPRVRRAIGLALNRQEAISLLSVGDFQLGLPFPPDTWFGRTTEEAEQLPGFRLLNGEKHPEDIAEAKRLLTEAGYPDGFKSEITLRQAGKYVDIGTIVAGQLKEYINVDLEIKLMESAAGIEAWHNGDFIVGIQSRGLVFLDPDAAFVEYKDGGQIGFTWARSYNQTNWARLNEIFALQSRESDPEKRRALIREAEDSLIFEDNAFPTLYYSTATVQIHKKIQGYNPHPSIYAINQKWETLWCDPAC